MVSIMVKDYSDLSIADVKKEFTFAFINNEHENIKAILTNPRLKEHVDKNSLMTAFNWACGENFHEISKYLIFEYNIEQFPEIMSHIDLVENNVVKNMFVIRELNKELKTELNTNPQEKIKLKL
jgi:hypothetical protein